MHYYRYENAEVSCCYKYLMFSYNIIFWVSFHLMSADDTFFCMLALLYCKLDSTLTVRKHNF